MKEKHLKIFAIVVLFLLTIGFFQQCSINNKLNDIKKNNETTSIQYINEIDSLKDEISKYNNRDYVTPYSMKRNMNSVMFNFLLWEGDLDKGKISLSEIQNKINESEIQNE